MNLITLDYRFLCKFIFLKTLTNKLEAREIFENLFCLPDITKRPFSNISHSFFLSYKMRTIVCSLVVRKIDFQFDVTKNPFNVQRFNRK